jgi:hypothetical protein
MVEPGGATDTWVRWTAVLDEPLVLSAIERSHETWRSAEAISAEVGLPLDRVQAVLDTASADLIVTPEADANGRALYSTRSHYRQTTSLFWRYIDALAT